MKPPGPIGCWAKKGSDNWRHWSPPNWVMSITRGAGSHRGSSSSRVLMHALENRAAASALPLIAAYRWQLPMPGRTRRQDIEVIQRGSGMQGIGRLRYDLFIERDGKGYEFADPVMRTFLEPIDEVSLNFHYTPLDETLASVRLSWAQDALDDVHLCHLVTHSGIPDDLLPRTTVTSRLAVRDLMPAKLRMLPMIRETCFAGLLSGVRFTIVSCRPSLVELFVRIGFFSTRTPIVDPVAGELEIMVLDAEDLDHLQSSGSPFLEDVKEYRALMSKEGAR